MDAPRIPKTSSAPQIEALLLLLSTPTAPLICYALDARFKVSVPTSCHMRIVLEVSDELENLGMGFYIWNFHGSGSLSPHPPRPFPWCHCLPLPLTHLSLLRR